ncbi:MAG: hypothetical protein ACQERT_15355 [Thermodesulfobacteriota bacterium]
MFASLFTSIITLSNAALIIVTAGSRLARVADELADRTGLGETLFGIFLLAAELSCGRVGVWKAAKAERQRCLLMKMSTPMQC